MSCKMGPAKAQGASPWGKSLYIAGRTDVNWSNTLADSEHPQHSLVLAASLQKRREEVCAHIDSFFFLIITSLLWCPKQPGESNSNSGLPGRGTNTVIRFGKP